MNLDFYSNWFYIGWRPTIGWIITTALAVNFILFPLLQLACPIFLPDVKVPELDSGQLVALVTLALGSKALRTYEKGKEHDDSI